MENVVEVRIEKDEERFQGLYTRDSIQRLSTPLCGQKMHLKREAVYRVHGIWTMGTVHKRDPQRKAGKKRKCQLPLPEIPKKESLYLPCYSSKTSL